MPLNRVHPAMTSGVLKVSNGLSELAGGLSTGYQNTGYSALPVGVILPFPGGSIPTGWVTCHGQALSRSTNAELFAVIGTVYGAGDGSTTFNVPDLRGRLVSGRDNMGGTAASRLTQGVLGGNPNTLGGSGGSESLTTQSVTLSGSGTNVVTSSSNLQPTIILNFIIKANVNVMVAV